MKYRWEKRVSASVFDLADKALSGSKFNVVAVAVENSETGEAALLAHPECPVGGVIMADLWRDILGDADQIYGEAVDAMLAGPNKKKIN